MAMAFILDYPLYTINNFWCDDVPTKTTSIQDTI